MSFGKISLKMVTLDAECRYAQLHVCALWIVLNVKIKPIMLGVIKYVIMPSPSMLSVIMLIVMAPLEAGSHSLSPLISPSFSVFPSLSLPLSSLLPFSLRTA